MHGCTKCARLKLLDGRKEEMKRRIGKLVSLIIDLAIFVVGIPIVGFVYFVIDPLVAYYERVRVGWKE